MLEWFTKKIKIQDLEKTRDTAIRNYEKLKFVVADKNRELAKRKVPFFKNEQMLLVVYEPLHSAKASFPILDCGILNISLNLKPLFLSQSFTKEDLQSFKEHPEDVCQDFLDGLKPTMVVEVPKILAEFGKDEK